MFQKFVALILGFLLFLFFYRDVSPLSVVGLRMIWFTLGVTVVNAYFIRREIKKFLDLSLLLFPVLFIWSAIAVVFLLPGGALKLLGILITILLFIKIEANPTARYLGPFEEKVFFITAFGLFLGVWTLDYYFNFSWWLVILLFFGICFALLWSAFYPLGTTLYRKLLYCHFAALLLAQSSWALLFWSLHYFTMSVVFMGFFYLAWIIFRLQLEANINGKKVFFHVMLVTVLEATALTFARWLPPR
ncbi:MAG: hypothetical protein AAB871_01485 [Patescibacteria group bacterium]